ncbi:MAG: histidine phosphatase family protein [Melioribacteraceae bacterium]|nr:histidine phosphatase family protein [Melioribacteraceae bacterium]
MYIQRHGESEANEQRVYSCIKLDPSIIEAGRKHIESLLPYYAELGIISVITSQSKEQFKPQRLLQTIWVYQSQSIRRYTKLTWAI